jgi:1-acyl-sn-glycerol-3-phosphate acyltransferase
VALRSPAMCRFFAEVMDRQMRRSFRAVRLARPGAPRLPEGRPVVVYSNHPSWWDPAFFIVLAPRLFPDRESYGRWRRRPWSATAS